jgi:formylglycine-generating enzyme required for sulfatase activity
MNNLASKLPIFYPESWAHSYGQDDYGVWHGVYLGEIEQRFRWIPPGRFWMGSPADEPERYDDEGPRQQITFEQGFWLAETACPQALWQAVMRKNPSRFQEDPQQPVENVSWGDAKRFIEALNEQIPGFNCRLPSEAEWEYACRAGTETPFWFGEALSTDEANYDGNKPYHEGKKGEYRKRAVPVKSFRRNPWGLYQMHGNVWEWCEDVWHPSHQGADPQGRPRLEGESEDHVCRGGSWILNGRYLRAACRSDWHFGLGYGGLRLARGPESTSKPEG